MDQKQWIKHKLWIEIQSLFQITAIAVLLGALGYIIAGEFMAVFVLGMVFAAYHFLPKVSPHLLLRMNKGRELKPHQAPNIHGLVHTLARKAGLTNLPTLYYLPSTGLNAFAVGSIENGAIALSDGLIRNLNLNEIAGVLGHEISHLKNGDLKILAFADISSRFATALSLTGYFLILLSLPLIIFLQYQINWAVLLFLAFAPHIANLLFFYLSQTREYDADLGASELTGDPEGLASALNKIQRHQDGFLKRLLFQGYRFSDPMLQRTHPLTQERIRRLMEVRDSQSAYRILYRPVFNF